MGKRRFAGTLSSSEHKHDVSKYASFGVLGHIRGWNRGVEVACAVDEDGKDEFHVYVTPGSNGGENRQLIAVVHENGTVDHFYGEVDRMPLAHA